MIYDVIIIGAGAAGLFAGINLPKNLKKLILEKNKNPGVKVLLSGGERANVSNIDIEAERDYFTQNKKALIGVFAKYNHWDIQSFFAENGVNIVEEDRGRLILESGDSKELLELLVRKAKENKCEIKCNSDVKKISPHTHSLLGEEREQGHLFEIICEDGKKYNSKNVIVSSGGKSFFQVGTTGEGYNFAKNFGLNIIPQTQALGGLSTRRNLSEISGISHNLKIEVFDKKIKKNNIIYSEFGSLLFTHFGISGPIIFNAGNAIGEYLNKFSIENYEKYILDNISVRIFFEDIEKIPKRIVKFFDLKNLRENFIELDLQNFRSWKEAKATGGGIDLNELDKNFMSKKVPGLYFIGEVVDVTGKTGGFNLQWAWSSGYVCGKSFE